MVVWPKKRARQKILWLEFIWLIYFHLGHESLWRVKLLQYDILYMYIYINIHYAPRLGTLSLEKDNRENLSF